MEKTNGDGGAISAPNDTKGRHKSSQSGDKYKQKAKANGDADIDRGKETAQDIDSEKIVSENLREVFKDDFIKIQKAKTPTAAMGTVFFALCSGVRRQCR